jgi:hypothetical protein
MMDDAIDSALTNLETKQYSFRNYYRKSYSHTVYQRVFDEDDSFNGGTPWLTDNKFVQAFRMHRSSFWQLVNHIKRT